ncbi:O-antigen ligase family protein [Neisseria sp. Ec49-e6-T10]|uniref:O-antigen ligase family protein n=1 Tax=Neisseria sp. Ec49-e6-T10 TaxID=3140744 RepID=UPI003EB92972
MFKKLFTKETSLDFVPLVFFALILTLPFTLNTRLGPNTSYILDNITVSLCLLMVLTLGLQGQLWQKVPKTSWFFLILALLWYIQTLFIPLHFVGQSYFAIGVFLSMALLAFATQALIKKFGQQKIITLLAIALMFGALIQAAVGIIQLLDLTKFYNTLYDNYSLSLNKLITISAKGTIFGQLAQRNHYAHYLMWGVISTCYLYSINKIRLSLSIFILATFSILMAAAASRLVVLYAFMFMFMTLIWFYRKKDIFLRKFLLLAIISATLIMLFQIPIISELVGIKSTGLSRVSSGLGFFGSRRFYESYKAWLLFKEYPFLGVGWSQYAYNAFQLDSLPYFINEPKEPGLFIHSHNSFLQILAEMGLFITLVVCLGFFWVIKKYITKTTLNSLFPLVLISTSLIHSLLEYPLWYVYFLAPFTVFMSLQNLEEKDSTSIKTVNTKKKIPNIISGLIAFCLAGVLLTQIILLIPRYALLHNAYILRNVNESKDDIKKDILPLVNTSILLRYEAVYTLESSERSTTKVDETAYKINQQLIQYRPFAFPLMRRSIYLSLKGKIEEAVENQKIANHYYPTTIPNFLQVLNVTNLTQIKNQTRQDCMNLMKKLPKTKCQTSSTKGE